MQERRYREPEIPLKTAEPPAGVNNVPASEIYRSVKPYQTYIDSGDSQVHVQVGVY